MEVIEVGVIGLRPEHGVEHLAGRAVGGAQEVRFALWWRGIRCWRLRFGAAEAARRHEAEAGGALATSPRIEANARYDDRDASLEIERHHTGGSGGLLGGGGPGGFFGPPFGGPRGRPPPPGVGGRVGGVGRGGRGVL